MRLIKPNFWNFQRVLHTLAATQEVLRHTRLHSRGSTRVPPTFRGVPFPPPISRGGILSLRVRKEFLAFPSHLKSRHSPQVRREELQGRATIPRVPQMSQSIPGKPVFTALPRLSSRGSLTPRWHVGEPCGKASWESIVGKTRGKDTDPLIHAKGSVTLVLQLGGKRTCMPPLETRTNSPGETPEIPQDPCQHWRGILRFWHRLPTRS